MTQKTVNSVNYFQDIQALATSHNAYYAIFEQFARFARIYILSIRDGFSSASLINMSASSSADFCQ